MEKSRINKSCSFLRIWVVVVAVVAVAFRVFVFLLDDDDDVLRQSQVVRAGLALVIKLRIPLNS